MICTACYSSDCDCPTCKEPGCTKRLTRATKPSGYCRQHHPNRCEFINQSHAANYGRGGERCNNLSRDGGLCFKHREEGDEFPTACPVEFCQSPIGVPCRGVIATQVPTHRERIDPEYAARIAKIMAEIPPMELVVRRIDDAV